MFLQTESGLQAEIAGDGVKCWELSTGSRVEFDHAYQSFRGQVSGIAWLKAATNLDVLCYVTGLGYVVTCCLSPVEAKFQEGFCTNVPEGIAPSSEITSVVANPSTGRLATGSRNCHIQLWQLQSTEEKYENKQELELQFDIKLDFVPRWLAFIEAKDHNIFAFATYNGQWNKLSGRDGRIIDSGDIHKPMRHREEIHQSSKWAFKDILDYIVKILALLILLFYILQNQDWASYNSWLYKQMLHSMHTGNVKLTSTKTLGSVPPSVPPPIPQDAALYMAAVQEMVQKTLKDMSTAQLMQDFERVGEKSEAEAAKRQRRNAKKSIIFA
ncbi:hypothetical protein M422DRAFT_267287 [Sphaerobolus stellatus SS14]|uniref:Uncharacterized protein n=1 Tax=Sphaerobolus stellatus (strain SS14) TaxID=990650 RepID=A0A0C9TM87_SPHS4|nr:hypothetical protein M422DRAFT_267287 [Sphaerobolus stellatus SS14]